MDNLPVHDYIHAEHDPANHHNTGAKTDVPAGVTYRHTTGPDPTAKHTTGAGPIAHHNTGATTEEREIAEV